MRINRRKSWLLLMMVCLLLSGCRKETGTTLENREGEETGLQIGISMDSFLLERWLRERDVFVSEARELGATVNIQNSNGDLEAQIAQVDYFIEKKVDAILLIAIDAERLTEAVERAHKAGIPVIAYDRIIKNANVDLYISFDNEKVGFLMGEHMKEHLNGKGTLLQICGPLEDANVSQIMKGFDEAIKDTELKIDYTEYAKGWLAEIGFAATNSYLGSYPAPKGIMCGNDGLAGQAIRSLSEHRLASAVCVVGQDADLDACQRIVEGTQCMTVYKAVEQLAKRAAQLSVALAKGEEIQVEETMYDGTYEVPYERFEPIAVTKENMDEIITGKYHERSDIYLNVR